jgi:hypothetical protein
MQSLNETELNLSTFANHHHCFLAGGIFCRELDPCQRWVAIRRPPFRVPKITLIELFKLPVNPNPQQGPRKGRSSPLREEQASSDGVNIIRRVGKAWALRLNEPPLFGAGYY